MRYTSLILCFILAAWASAGLAAGPGPATDMPAASAREIPLVEAQLALGARYRRGGRSLAEGFDCSGLVAHVFEKSWGLALPANALAQSAVGLPVKLAELEPGDLVFYNTRNRPFSHVGIYLGEGRFIHAPRPGAQVRVESVQSRYWRQRFSGARRLEPPHS